MKPDLLIDYDRAEDLPGLGWVPLVARDGERMAAIELGEPGGRVEALGHDGEVSTWGGGRDSDYVPDFLNTLYYSHWRAVGQRGRITPDSARVAGIVRARLERAGYSVVEWSLERSTNGWHARAELAPKPRSPMEIVALQAVCGSDPLREACNVQRAAGVQDMGSYAATVLLKELAAVPQAALPASARAGVEFMRGYLERRLAEGDGFFVTRWNTLYEPAHKRAATSEHDGVIGGAAIP